MKKICLILISLSFFVNPAIAASVHEPRHIFQKAWEQIDTSALFRNDWGLYPAYQDREAWNKYLGDFKEELISAGEKYLGFEWRIIKATDYLAFERTGDRSSMQVPNFANLIALRSLVMAELAEGKGRFIDDIINGVWFQTERTTWVYSAHQYRQKTGRALPDYRDVFIDLSTQSTGIVVATALYFFEEEWNKIDPVIGAAVRNTLKKQVFDPYINQSKWKSQSWLGFPEPGQARPYFWENWDPRNNWNIWCNLNVATIYLLTRPDRKTLMEGLDLAIKSADNYLDFVDMDGACDEGPAYWGHASGCLYEFIHLFNEATGGKFGCWDDPQYVARCKYISRANLGDGWSVNFSDGAARSVGSIPLCYCMGKESDLKEMLDYSVYLAACSGELDRICPSGTITARLNYIKVAGQYAADMKAALEKAGGDVEVLKKMCLADVPAGTWYPGTEHFVFKSAKGVQYAAKGGHNEESHNHNDVGSIILFSDSMPVLVDVGPTTYMRQTFNKKERYTIWSMRSEWHNVPMMNGKPQHDGGEYAAAWSKADPKKGTFSAEIAGAYEKEAGVKSLVRSCSLQGSTFTIVDKFALESRLAADEEHFMVRGEVEKVAEGKLLIKFRSFDGTKEGSAVMTYPSSLSATVETRELDDPRHIAVWGGDLKRIVLKSADNAPVKGSYKIQISVLHTSAKCALYTLSNKNGMEVSITNFGARIVSLMVPDRDGKLRDVCLGFDNIASYIDHPSSFGAVMGRYVNRIKGASFVLDGKEYTLPKNNGENCIHGGPRSWQYSIYDVEESTKNRLSMSLISPDGEFGFPGEIRFKVIYTLTEDNKLDVRFLAQTNAPTVINVTNHSFFNLSGDSQKTVHDHILMVDADAYTPVDQALIPTGEIKPVEGSAYDFRKAREVGPVIREMNGNVVLNHPGDDSVVAAQLYCPSTGIVMSVYTDQPGLQIYTAGYLNESLIGKGGSYFRKYTGICLETQHFPDSPHHSHFPSTVLRPGVPFDSHTTFAFSTKL